MTRKVGAILLQILWLVDCASSFLLGSIMSATARMTLETCSWDKQRITTCHNTKIHRKSILEFGRQNGPKLFPSMITTSNRQLHSVRSSNNFNDNNNEGEDNRKSLKKSNFEDVERIFAISDLHTDNTDNLSWLIQRCTNATDVQTSTLTATNTIPGPNDALIIAGDISHELSRLRETLEVIASNLSCHIFFVFGNHEAWVGGQELDSLGIETSLVKLQKIEDLCEELGVLTCHQKVGTNQEFPAWIVPLESWYDATLSLEGCEDLCEDFARWPWVDFIRCEWPEEYSYQCQIQNGKKNNGDEKGVNDISFENMTSKVKNMNTGKVPIGLTEMFLQRNEQAIKEVRQDYCNWLDQQQQQTQQKQISTNGSTNVRNISISKHEPIPPGLITFTHFLPNKMTLPDWKDPQSDTFQREEWLDHPIPDVSAKFAKVAGSALIDKQIRSILPHRILKHQRQYTHLSSSSNANGSVRNNEQSENGDNSKYSKPKAQTKIIADFNTKPINHLHVFGHSHRPKDFVKDGVRYIHNPLGKPAERDMKMVSSDVGFQLIWDCTGRTQQRLVRQHQQEEIQQHSYQMTNPADMTHITYDAEEIINGEVQGEQIIRYWEEKGGGKVALARNMRNQKRRRKLMIKRFARDVKLHTKKESGNDS